MRILIYEEYGYKHWLWEVDADWDDIQDLLDVTIRGSQHFYSGNPDLPEQFPDGTWEEISYEEYKEIRDAKEFDAIGMLHEQNDSWYSHYDDIKFHNPYTGETFND